MAAVMPLSGDLILILLPRILPSNRMVGRKKKQRKE
jgi:hypothetical protein